MINYYEVLQINNNANEAVVRAAYRTIMKELGKHPDHGGNTREAQVINEAYQNLIDPLKRNLYDQRLRKWQQDTTENNQHSNRQQQTSAKKENTCYFVVKCQSCSTNNRVDISLINKSFGIRCGNCSNELTMPKNQNETQLDTNTLNLVSNLEQRNWKVINNSDNFYNFKIKSDFFLKNYIYIKKVSKITPENIASIASEFKNTFCRHITPVGHYFILVADKIEYLSFVIEEIKKQIAKMSGWSQGIIIPVDLSRKQVFLSHVNLNHHPADILKLRSFMFN